MRSYKSLVVSEVLLYLVLVDENMSLFGYSHKGLVTYCASATKRPDFIVQSVCNETP
jgi:hypothetical protein